MARAILSHVLLVLLVACGNEAPSYATLIDPIYGDPCQFEVCSEHGQCTAGSDAGPVCACEVGYAGDSCQRCEAGFHTDARGRCAPDRSCAEQPSNPCGLYGSCQDQDGVIACHCDPGYEGPRCTLCQNGYGRSDAGDCLQLVLGDGAGSDGEAGPGQVSACSVDFCRGHGACDDESGQPVCECDRGHAGTRCEACATRFHAESDRCVLDAQCLKGSCPENATCEDESGEVACLCGEGYTGQDCDACAAGYVRDHARGTCTNLACVDNPIPGPGVFDFEGNVSFPTYENNCVSGVVVDSSELMVTSLGGDGEVWACASNTVYGVSGNHVFVEAGIENSAELIFSGPIAQVSFDYGARTELALEVMGDGKVTHVLVAERRAHGAVAFAFDPPITLFALHSTNGMTQQVALDNIVYAPPVCP